MAARRKPMQQNSGTSTLNFRPSNADSLKWEMKGTKPVPEQSSVVNVLLMMLLHVCRKIMFVDTIKRVAVYCGCLFLISLLGDVMPIPKCYLSRSENVLNQYFVKFGWGWTMLVTFPFLVLTSFTICCGRRDLVVKHCVRLCVATASWMCWTELFAYIEVYYGKCSSKVSSSKRECLAHGHYWDSFDISGHAFILVYSSLLLIEEARAIVGWERIRDLIRDEHHTRSLSEEGKAAVNSSALAGLSEEEFLVLKSCYQKYTPIVRTLFIVMTCFSVLWDFMLLFTMLYFHNMVEKLLSGVIAIFTWFITYHVWYAIPKVIPDLPGDGLFRYKGKDQSEPVMRKRKSTAASSGQIGQLPRFMGMPLYGLRSQENDKSEVITGGSSL